MSANGTGSSFMRFVDVAEESTWAETLSSPTTYRLRVNSIEIIDNQSLIPNNAYKGDRKPGEPIYGENSAGIRITTFVYPDEIGWWLKAAVGTPASSGSSGARSHLFKSGFSGASEGVLPVGWNFDVGYTDLATPQYGRLVGARCQSMSWPYNPNGALEVSFEFVGQGWSYSASPMNASVTAYTSSPLSQSDMNTLNEGGGASTICRGGNLNLNNQMQTNLYTCNNSSQIGDLIEGVAEVTGTNGVLFKDLTFLNKSLNGTESSLEAAWTDGTDTVTLEVPELKYERTSPSADGSALQVQANWRAFEGNDADATPLKVTLANTVYSY